MLPEVFDLIGNDAIYRGDSRVYTLESGGYSENNTFLPDDLTGVTAKINFRISPYAAEVLELFSTDEDGGLTIPEPTNGQIIWEIKPEDTMNEEWTSGVYDVELTFPDGRVRTILKGRVEMVRDVTY